VLIDDGLHNKPTILVPQPWNSATLGSLSWDQRHLMFWNSIPYRFGAARAIAMVEVNYQYALC
jgi:hypothetical protein